MMRGLCVASLAMLACAPANDAADDESGSTSGSTSGCGPVEDIDPFASEPSCETLFLADVEGERIVQVRIVNATDRGIALVNRTSGCNQPARRFDVTGTAGGRELTALGAYCPTQWDACATYSDAFSGCQSCETLHHHVYIEPGGFFDEPWDAWVIGDVEMPGTCVGEEVDISCAAATVLPSGSFTLTARAAQVDNGDLGCECAPDASGSCYAEPTCTIDPSLMAVTAYDGVCDALEITFTD
jgi:hypothetical protein